MKSFIFHHIVKNNATLYLELNEKINQYSKMSKNFSCHSKIANTRCRTSDNVLQINYTPLFCAMKNLSAIPSSSLFPVLFPLLVFPEFNTFFSDAAMVDNGKIQFANTRNRMKRYENAVHQVETS